MSWSAFGFYVVVFLIAWTATLYFMLPPMDEAGRYWLTGDFTAMKPTSAMLYLAGVLWTAYLCIITLMMMPTVYSVFVKLKIGSDQRIKDILGRRLWSATKLWFAAIAFALLFGLLTELMVPTAQHLFKREAWSIQSERKTP